MPLTRVVVRTAAGLLFAAYLLFSSTFLLFAVLDSAPSLTRYTVLKRVPYFAEKRHYQADPLLVFVPREVGHPSRWNTEFVGDQYSPAYGVPHAGIPYRAAYTADGFRENSSSPPYDVLLIGDSYVEIGETDQLTLTEQLRLVSGLRTFNLGRGWYGPFQYLELFKQYAPRLKPRYAVLCFFDGNDAEDTGQYLRWRRGERYYHFLLSESYLNRYFAALRDSYALLAEHGEQFIDGRWPPVVKDAQPAPGQEKGRFSEVHSDLGLIALGDRLLPMQVTYWNKPLTTQQLLESEEWQAIGRVLKEFQRLATEQGIVPLALFIPKKAEVYGAFYSAQSGHNFFQRISSHMRFRNNSHDAFLAVADQAGIRTIDLLPVFRTLAGEGKVLYYSFDTHWNPLGRHTAAEILAASLSEMTASVSTCGSCDKRRPIQ
jgi:hypothetical protein